MSSSEQAPEPTMDEILASIRKIISDDEPGGTAQQEGTASEQPTPETAAPKSGAPENDGLSGDLAKALNTAPEPTKSPDEILDLTQVVEQQVSLEAETAAAPQPDLPPVPPLGETLQGALKEMGDENASAPDASSSPAQPAGEKNISTMLAEAGALDTPGQAPIDAAMEAPGGGEMSSGLGQAGDPAASAETRPASDTPMAGGELDAMAEPSPSAAASPDQPVEAPPSIELPDAPLADVAADEEAAGTMADIPAAETLKGEPADASMAGGGSQPDELAMKMPDLQPEAPEVSAEADPAGLEEAPGAEVVAAAVMIDAQTEDAMPDGQDTSDASVAAEQGGKSLEDSVKEMLRPLLREWLDDNMDRIVQDAVKDEVGSGKFKSGIN